VSHNGIYLIISRISFLVYTVTFISCKEVGQFIPTGFVRLWPVVWECPIADSLCVQYVVWWCLSEQCVLYLCP